MAHGMFRRLALGAGALAGLMMVEPAAVVAQTPTAGTDLSGKAVYLRRLSVLRYQESFTAKIYTLTRVPLEVRGRGACTSGWCPLVHNNVNLFARRTHIDLAKPASGLVLTERTLRRGDEGADVKVIQDVLVKKGAGAIKTDGKFGPGTEAAVKDFQRRNGLTADGAIGPETRKKLVG